MPVHPRVLASVVRVYDAGSYEGSASIVTVPTESGRRFPYLVTAHHVVANSVGLTVRAPDPLEPAKLSDAIAVPPWWQPFRGIDLAITPFPQWKVERYQGTPVEDFIPAGRVPPLGGTLYYIGVFAPLDVPMVRAGTLAALDVPVTTGGGYSYRADLMDCRSYRGFSGSPVFSMLSYAELVPMAELPRAAQSEAVTPPPPLGRIAYGASFAGIFTAHLSDEDAPDAEGSVSRYGVGIMVPCEAVQEALMDETLAKAREEADQEMTRAEAASAPPIEEASMGESEFERFEALTQKLVNTPKPKGD